MPLSAKKGNKKYTYQDYLAWPDEERWEIIDGVAYDMSPAPGARHQRVLAALTSKFYNYLEGKPCEVFTVPFDVLLSEGNEADEDISNVVQPDIMVICDPDKITEKGCKGAPDLVIEILSPSTAGKDMTIELTLYEKVHVKEYWIVDPIHKTWTLDKVDFVHKAW